MKPTSAVLVSSGGVFWAGTTLEMSLGIFRGNPVSFSHIPSVRLAVELWSCPDPSQSPRGR